MVSDKVIVVLLIVAIILSLVSTIVTLSANIGGLRSLGRSGNTIIYQGQPEEERAGVGIVVEQPKKP